MISNSQKRHPYLFYILILALFTLIALMNFVRFVTSELAEGNPGKIKFYFVMETTGAYTSLLLLPIIIWFFRRFRLTRRNWLRRLPLYLAASVLYGLSHTFLMYLSRLFIYWIINWGTYDYGRWTYRIPMEYMNQFFDFAYIYVVFYLYQMILENQQEKLRAAKLKEQLTEVQLHSLQMQLKPHFLFNTLNLISSTMYDDVRAADKMMANLSELLRITLNSHGVEEHPLEKELELINLYLDIMKARFQEHLFVEYKVSPDCLDAQVPGFILQPLVENAIQHNRNQLAPIGIKISAAKVAEQLHLEILDNGKGIPQEKMERNTHGIGLSNTAARLENLFGSAQKFLLQNQSGQGLRVSIQIPFFIKA